MGIENMEKLFKPRNIAVVGASSREGSVGHSIFRNLILGGFKGNVFPVNTRHKTVNNEPSYKSVLDIPQPVDLAVLVTPIATASGIIRECVEKGVGGAVILSAGGKETGKDGVDIEASIKAEALKGGLRIIGPNCLGIYSAACRMNAHFASHIPIEGNMAFISQSGAICTSVLDLAAKERIGFRYFVSMGSMVDVEFGDMIDYLGADPDVSSIMMYVENLTRFRNFMSAARAVSRIKPIIALKAGRTRAGSRAASSHTGAMTGEDAIYDAAFKRAGVIRVQTFEELFDCAELLAKKPRVTSQGLAVITNAGGMGVMAVDAMSDHGIDPVKLSPQTLSALDGILPAHWSHANPIDILGDANPERYRKTVEICMAAPEVKALLVMLSPVAMTRPSEIAEALVDLVKDKPFPVFTSFVGGFDVELGRELFNQAGIPTFDSPERAIRAYNNLDLYTKNLELLQEIPPVLDVKFDFRKKEVETLISHHLDVESPMLTEKESKHLLSLYGIPVNPVEFAAYEDEAVQKAENLGYPLAMKIDSRDISHKSDVGGVILDIKNREEVRNAYKTIMNITASVRPDARIKGVTLQAMLEKSTCELILGAKRDKDFGPVILFGLGGIMTEIISDKALALPPLNRLLARRLMEETKVMRILKGYRGQKPANIALLEEIIIRLSHLVSDFSEIEELDINPLFACENKIMAADARIKLSEHRLNAPHHLVISPYPNQYEDHIVIKSGESLFIRPIRPEDAPLLVTLFEGLSPRTVYFRFFSPLKQLPPSMLARFTQIDYDRSMALSAFLQTDEGEKMVGVARFIGDTNPKSVEFAVMIEDHWQGKGIGAELMKRLIAIARERGVKNIRGTVLAENTQMLALGKKMGFDIKAARDAGCYELNVEMD
jgi:acetyltransferase